MSQKRSTAQIDRLMDAIEMIQDDRRERALYVLRGLIQEDKDFEEAWLWMSVAVDNIDQSVLCLDNVLRINPHNARAAGALYRLRESDILNENRRANLHFYRDLSLSGLWFLIMFLIFASLYTFSVVPMSAWAS